MIDTRPHIILLNIILLPIWYARLNKLRNRSFALVSHRCYYFVFLFPCLFHCLLNVLKKKTSLYTISFLYIIQLSKVKYPTPTIFISYLMSWTYELKPNSITFPSLKPNSRTSEHSIWSHFAVVDNGACVIKPLS